MGISVVTNTASIQAQNNLNKASSSLTKTLTRLSTGLKINSARDDAVGLAQSELLKGKIRGIDVARSNIAKSNSVLGVADGALVQLEELGFQMRDLAVQASDSTISAADRATLVDNFSALQAEYDRAVQGANYNGDKLLTGQFVNKTSQIGNDSDQYNRITFSVSDTRSATVGRVAIYTSQTRSLISNAAFTSTTDAFTAVAGIQINGTTIASTSFASDGVSYIEDQASALAYVNAINTYSAQTGVKATALANVQTFTYTAGSASIANTSYLKLNGITIKAASDGLGFVQSDDSMAALAGRVNDYTAQTGVSAVFSADTDTLVFTAQDGRNISFTTDSGSNNGGLFFLGAAASGGTTGGYTNAAFMGTFKLSSDDAFTVTGASAEFAASAAESVAISTTTSLSNAALDSAANAQTAIDILDRTLVQLVERRAEIGRTQNLFELADSELASRSENLSAAKSAISDADVAAETAKYTQQSILQQAASTVLAQANSQPQIALSLLQNL